MRALGQGALCLALVFIPPMASAAPPGEFSFYWGYNRAAFSKSDIHFTGPGYDFTLLSVRAKDRPSNRFSDYVNRDFTVPQYNFRFGYQWKDWLNISLGMDHMKYVLVQDQALRMSGYVEDGVSSDYGGLYQRQPGRADEALVTFEHSDGLNVVTLDAAYTRPLWQSRGAFLGLSMLAGVGAGGVIPRSDVQVFGDGKNNRFHWAGYALTAHGGLRLSVGKTFFLRQDVKVGYVDLPDVLTRGTSADRAEHRFTFIEAYWVAGFRIGG